METRVFELSGFAILLLAGLFADRISKQNSRFPRLVALISIGAIFGQLALYTSFSQIINPLKDARLVSFIADFVLSLVLFREGLELNMKAFRQSLRSILILAFGGVILSSFIFAITISLFTPFTLVLALLIAGIMAPTDPAATFSLFKGGLRLKQKEKNIIGSESALNDAVAIVIVLEVFLKSAENGSIEISLIVFFALITSFFGGIFIGYLLGVIFLYINKNLRNQGQTTILSLTLIIISFVTASIIDENGIAISAAITSLTAGIVFGNPQFFKFSRFSKSHFEEFQAHISEIGEMIAFGAFGILLSFNDFFDALLLGLLFAFITLFSRYIVVVYILRLPTGLTKDESIFVAWAGMRGLATGVLAITAYEAFKSNPEGAANLPFAPDVFLTSVLVALVTMTLFQGSTLRIVGRKTKSINISNRKADLLVERKIIISKLAFYQKERDSGELTLNEYKELTIPLRDRLSQIYHELQIETISRKERMRSYVKELEMITTVIMDLGIDKDNVVAHDMHQEIKDSEQDIIQKIQNEINVLLLESESRGTRSIDKKKMLEILSETKERLQDICSRNTSIGTLRLVDFVSSIIEDENGVDKSDVENINIANSELDTSDEQSTTSDIEKAKPSI